MIWLPKHLENPIRSSIVLEVRSLGRGKAVSVRPTNTALTAPKTLRLPNKSGKIIILKTLLRQNRWTKFYILKKQNKKIWIYLETPAVCKAIKKKLLQSKPLLTPLIYYYRKNYIDCDVPIRTTYSFLPNTTKPWGSDYLEKHEFGQLRIPSATKRYIDHRERALWQLEKFRELDDVVSGYKTVYYWKGLHLPRKKIPDAYQTLLNENQMCKENEPTGNHQPIDLAHPRRAVRAYNNRSILDQDILGNIYDIYPE